jgi:hypothetical protein
MIKSSVCHLVVEKGFVSNSWAYTTGVLSAPFTTQNPAPTLSKDNHSLTDPALDFTQVPQAQEKNIWIVGIEPTISGVEV